MDNLEDNNVNNNQNLQPTSALDFKKKSQEVQVTGIVLELPSGNHARIRRPSLANMLKSGKIPSTLTNAAMRMLGQGSRHLGQQEIKEGIELVDHILTLSFVDPKVVKNNPKEDEIEVNDLTDDDRGFVFNYVQSGATELNNFRSK